MTLEEINIGEHRKAGRAMLLVALGNICRLEVLGQQAFAG